MHDSPGNSEQSSWYSRFAEKVNTDLREAQPWKGTESVHRPRIHENVDGTARPHRRAVIKWRSRTIRCFIAICIAAILVTAALVGAMVAIAKSSKDVVKLDASSVIGSSIYTVSETDARTTSRSTRSTSTPWSTTAATSEVITVGNPATSTKGDPTTNPHDSPLNAPVRSPESTTTKASLSQFPSSTEAPITFTLGDSNTAHLSNTTETRTSGRVPLPSHTTFISRTLAAGRPSQGGPEWLGDQGLRAPQRQGDHRHQDQNGRQ